MCDGPSVLRFYIVRFCLVFESCEDLDGKRPVIRSSPVSGCKRCSLLQQALVFSSYLFHQELPEIKANVLEEQV